MALLVHRRVFETPSLRKTRLALAFAFLTSVAGQFVSTRAVIVRQHFIPRTGGRKKTLATGLLIAGRINRNTLLYRKPQPNPTQSYPVFTPWKRRVKALGVQIAPVVTVGGTGSGIDLQHYLGLSFIRLGGSYIATGGGVSPPPPAANLMGVNLTRPNYYEANIPFLNVLKQAFGGASHSSWDTSGTDHPANLQLDSDGYPTSLTGIDSTVYSSIHTAVFVNISSQDGTAGTPPNLSSLYPSGPWTFRVTGKFVITLGGDVTNGSLATSTPGVTISGLQITSTQTGQAEVTFSATPSTAGIFITITSIPDAVNYPRAMALVPSTYISQYDAGEIFYPPFISTLQAVGWNGAVRFMDWLHTNNRTPQIQFSSTPVSGATSATINGIFAPDWGGTVWLMPTGTYPAIFSDGITRNCVFTAYSSTVTFSALSATQTNASVYPTTVTWATRSKPSNMNWAGQAGVPVEVCIALANKLGVNAWFNYPIDSDTTYVNGVANMFFDGTGASGGIGAAGLNAGLKCIVEFGNEVWNAGFPAQKYANYSGKLAFPASGSQSQEWLGMKTATVADAWYAIYGSSAFASRVIVSMGGQSATGNGSAFMIAAMNTPSWSSAAYTHHIGAMHYAPYFDNNLNGTDATAILATGDPSLTLLKLAWTNVVGGHTYSSVNASGYIGAQVDIHNTIFAAIAGQPWGNLPKLGYESGDAWHDGTGGTTGWKARLWATLRDTRFQYLYYDPNKTLDGVHTGYLPAMKAVGFQWLNQFNDIESIAGGFSWGAYESVMQTVMPPKATGMMNFIIGP